MLGLKIILVNTVKLLPTLVGLLTCLNSYGQTTEQLQFWEELYAADLAFSNRSAEIGRRGAFQEFLGVGSVVFRGGGPVDAQELYNAESIPLGGGGDSFDWKPHYVDVSRDGDLGFSAGPYVAGLGTAGEDSPPTFGYLASIWKREAGQWRLMVDMVAGIPGFLSLEVSPDFEDTKKVFLETADPMVANVEENTFQSLIAADEGFALSINVRGGQRALLRRGLANSRVYLPTMAPAVGAESAAAVYGAYLDVQLSTINPVTMIHLGGYMSTSKDMGFTYGTMATSDLESEIDGFEANYLRLWRYTSAQEWQIAVEVLRPFISSDAP
jgi:hypothetical protein